jgi:hypothetical protein
MVPSLDTTGPDLVILRVGELVIWDPASGDFGIWRFDGLDYKIAESPNSGPKSPHRQITNPQDSR